MKLETLSPRQRQMATEIAEHLFTRYADMSARSYVDAAYAIAFVSEMFQVDLKEAEANLND